jgi:hypothetical protein
VCCRLLIRCWIAKRRSPDKTRMRAHPGFQPVIPAANCRRFYLSGSRSSAPATVPRPAG